VDLTRAYIVVVVILALLPLLPSTFFSCFKKDPIAQGFESDGVCQLMLDVLLSKAREGWFKNVDLELGFHF
jgi:hypothetical protein